MNWSYIAGFFDGEGNISIRTPNNKYSGRGVILTVAQKKSNADVIYKMKVFLAKQGIESHIYVQKAKNDNWEDGVRLQISNREDGKCFLSKIVNKLYVKKAEAMKALRYYDTAYKKKVKDFTNDEVRQVVQMRISGLIYKEIASFFDTTPSIIRAVIRSQPNYKEIQRQFWDARSIRRMGLSKEEIETIISLYRSGKSVNEVAKITQHTPNKIGYLLRKRGLTRTSAKTQAIRATVLREQRFNEVGDKIIEEYKAGASTHSLSQKYGIGVHRICEFLKRQGVLRPKWYMMKQKRESILKNRTVKNSEVRR